MDKPDIKRQYKKRDTLLLLSRRYPTLEKIQTIQNLSDQRKAD